EKEQQNQRVTKSYPHRNRCTTLSQGGSDLDEIGGLRLGGNQQKGKLRSRFDKARELAGIDKAKFQFRDLRARGVTHKTIDEGLEAGQRLAGHSGPGMTARYVRGTRPVKPSR
ncbi:hypothetical protein LGM95_36055, partial [Burkholderia arboris]|nr:hypothetical protein [Burkholderia arboris]